MICIYLVWGRTEVVAATTMVATVAVGSTTTNAVVKRDDLIWKEERCCVCLFVRSSCLRYVSYFLEFRSAPIGFTIPFCRWPGRRRRRRSCSLQILWNRYCNYPPLPQWDVITTAAVNDLTATLLLFRTMVNTVECLSVRLPIWIPR